MAAISGNFASGLFFGVFCCFVVLRLMKIIESFQYLHLCKLSNILIVSYSKIRSITAFKGKNKAEEKAIVTERKQSSRCNMSESFNVKDFQIILSKGDGRLCYQWKRLTARNWESNR